MRIIIVSQVDSPAPDYPIQVVYSKPAFHNQFWAVPMLGLLVKMIIGRRFGIGKTHSD